MRADYMMMYSYNRERSLFITHAYGLSTEVWCCPDIYKRHLLRNFYRDMLTQLAHPDTTEESAKEYLRHTVEHLADDILHGSPTRHSTNAIENLAHTWEFETKQEMYNIAVGLHSQFED